MFYGGVSEYLEFMGYWFNACVCVCVCACMCAAH